MTPAERAVIEAAGIWADNQTEKTAVRRLAIAVDALTEERAAAPATAEHTRSWSEVVTEDEIYSTKTKKWYRVVSTVRLDTALEGDQVRVQCEGMAKPFTVPADGRVQVRRSEMGQAVDTWIDVMRSGPA